MKRYFSILVLAAVFGTVGSSAQSNGTYRWYKGNTHAHTLNSDGDSMPGDVVKWYRDAGYNFLFITDHEFITPVEPLNLEFGKPGEFLVLSGQEITDQVDKKPQHVNGLGIADVIRPQKAPTSVANLQANIDAVLAAGGIPQINHPNFGWSLSADTIARTNGVMHFELFNGHPLVNNLGGGTFPSTEQIWDAVLSQGRLFYGVASDDVHSVKRLGDRRAATPGHGWIMVRSRELSRDGILEALRKGDFYASTGVELESFSADQRSIAVSVKQERWSKYRIQFIGSGGKVLSEIASGTGEYRPKGNERYVRVKVLESNGKVAWTQPLMITASGPRR